MAGGEGALVEWCSARRAVFARWLWVARTAAVQGRNGSAAAVKQGSGMEGQGRGVA